MFLKRDYLEILFHDRARSGEGSWKLWRNREQQTLNPECSSWNFIMWSHILGFVLYHYHNWTPLCSCACELTSYFCPLGVPLLGQHWIGQLPEVFLEGASHVVHVKCVSVDLHRFWVDLEHFSQAQDLCWSPTQPVDAFMLQTCHQHKSTDFICLFCFYCFHLNFRSCKCISMIYSKSEKLISI